MDLNSNTAAVPIGDGIHDDTAAIQAREFLQIDGEADVQLENCHSGGDPHRT